MSPKLKTPTSPPLRPNTLWGKRTAVRISSVPLPSPQVPGGEGAQKLGALLTVCVKVLPDFQELGRRQLGQVQVRGLLLRASHGEPLRDLRQHRALPAHRLRSRTRPGAARHAAFIYGPRLRRRPAASRGRERSGNRSESSRAAAAQDSRVGTTGRQARGAEALRCKGERGCPCLFWPSCVQPPCIIVSSSRNTTAVTATTTTGSNIDVSLSSIQHLHAPAL